MLSAPSSSVRDIDHLGCSRDWLASLVDIDNDFRDLSCLSIDRIDDSDNDIAILLRMLVLALMDMIAAAVWLGGNEGEHANGSGEEGLRLHLEIEWSGKCRCTVLFRGRVS